MKKLWVVLAMLLLTACGGGGGGGTHVTGPTPITNETPTGMLNVSFTDQNASKSLAAIVPAKIVRIVITNRGILLNNQYFSVIQDAVPGAALSFALPVTTGYSIEALAYLNDPVTGLNTVVKYAIATNVRVDPVVPTDLLLTLNPVMARMVLPTAIYQGVRYNIVQANLSTAGGRLVTPLSNSWYLVPPQTTTLAPFTNNTSATSYTTSHFFSAPITGGLATKLFFQGVFTIKPGLLKPGETQKQWIYNSPEVSADVQANTNLVITAPDF